MILRLVLMVLCAVTLAACAPNPDKEIASLREQIAAFRNNPTAEREVAIEKAFSTLEAQIEELDKKGRASLADGLRLQIRDLRTNYEAAKIARTVKEAQSAIQGLGQAIKDAGRTIGEALRTGTNVTEDNE
ncbi:MAG: hypothetical protein Fur0032_21310 [Terrimicrobiaceae bacterium]